jgi:hypothetical protein
MTNKRKHMTVAQAIEFLSKVGDKNMALMIDCPHCGKGNQLAFIDEAVILSTPTPWAVFEHVDHSGLAIGPPYTDDILKGHVRSACTISGSHYHPKYRRACAVDDTDRANAELIVKAVNSYSAMLEALKALSHYPDSNVGSDWKPVFDQARAAISLAEGKTK